MKLVTKLSLIFGLLLSLNTLTHAEETIGEQIEVKGKNVKRSIKRNINKIKQENCTKGKVKCLSIKGEDKLKEAAEATQDKTQEIINKID